MSGPTGSGSPKPVFPSTTKPHFPQVSWLLGGWFPPQIPPRSLRPQPSLLTGSVCGLPEIIFKKKNGCYLKRGSQAWTPWGQIGLNPSPAASALTSSSLFTSLGLSSLGCEMETDGIQPPWLLRGFDETVDRASRSTCEVGGRSREQQMPPEHSPHPEPHAFGQLCPRLSPGR